VRGKFDLEKANEFPYMEVADGNLCIKSQIFFKYLKAGFTEINSLHRFKRQANLTAHEIRDETIQMTHSSRGVSTQ
jgi:hypothetical protein